MKKTFVALTALALVGSVASFAHQHKAKTAHPGHTETAPANQEVTPGVVDTAKKPTSATTTPTNPQADKTHTDPQPEAGKKAE